MTIEQLGNDIQAAITASPNPFLKKILSNSEITVSFPRPGKRRIRRDADAEKSFKPDEPHEILVRLVPREAPDATAEVTFEFVETARPDPETPKAETDALKLIRALDRIAGDPRVNFIGLKWFRDHVLREAGLSSFEARAALEDAIERGLVKVEKLNNPNSPFPTSTLRLNRTPEVIAALDREPATPARRGFSPIEVQGVSLSGTVLEGRR